MSFSTLVKYTLLLVSLQFPIVLSANEVIGLRHCFHIFDYPKNNFEQLPGNIDNYDVCISKTSSHIDVKDHTFYQKSTSLPVNSVIRLTDGTILNVYISEGNERHCKNTMPIYLSKTNNVRGVGCIVLDFGYKKTILKIDVKYFAANNKKITGIGPLLGMTVSASSVRCKSGETVCNNLIPIYESTIPKEGQ